MTKKNRKANEKPSDENESAEVEAGLGDSAINETEASGSDADSQSVDDASMDDLLDDVRRSLIESEHQDDKKKAGWLSRITKGFQKDQSTDVVHEVDQPETVVADALQPKEDYLEQIDELIDMLEPEPDTAGSNVEEASPPLMDPVQVLDEPTTPVNLDELKKRVFSSAESGADENFSEVRAVALGDGESVFVEVESKKEDAVQERVKALENALQPYRRYVYFLVAFLGVLLAIVAIGMMSVAYQRSRPPVPTPTVGNLPYPVNMALPGGLSFNLGRGAIVDGQWNPAGAEWLAGTEICRWVAIPWSKQLEAVMRTLTPEDVIELGMSNGDSLTYNVFSIEELTLAEMQALDQNTPCLLLVLAEQDAEKRWVVTAKP